MNPSKHFLNVALFFAGHARRNLPPKRLIGTISKCEEEAFAALSGFKSLPFPRPARLGKGESWRIAIKVLDSRGNEGLRVLTMT